MRAKEQHTHTRTCTNEQQGGGGRGKGGRGPPTCAARPQVKPPPSVLIYLACLDRNGSLGERGGCQVMAETDEGLKVFVTKGVTSVKNA